VDSGPFAASIGVTGLRRQAEVAPADGWSRRQTVAPADRADCVAGGGWANVFDTPASEAAVGGASSRQWCDREPVHQCLSDHLGLSQPRAVRGCPSQFGMAEIGRKASSTIARG
jgi:hypothetical protein